MIQRKEKQLFAKECFAVRLIYDATIWGVPLLHVFVTWNFTATLLRWWRPLFRVGGGMVRTYFNFGGGALISNEVRVRVTPILSDQSFSSSKLDNILWGGSNHLHLRGHSPPFVADAETHIMSIYYLAQYTDVGSRWYFGVERRSCARRPKSISIFLVDCLSYKMCAWGHPLPHTPPPPQHKKA